MGTITLTLPIAGTGVVAGLLANDMTTIQTVINGNLDNNNIAAGAAIADTKLALAPVMPDRVTAGWNNLLCALTTGLGATGWLRGAATLGRVGATGAVFRAADEPFLAAEGSFGRAGLAVGFPLAFEVVTRPFAFERRSELRGAPLPIPRYRSI